VNYALEVLVIRQCRDSAIEYARRRRRSGEIKRAREAARWLLTASREARDREIWRLHTEDPSLSLGQIAGRVGCSGDSVYQVLRPDRHEAYNQRRRDHQRRRRAGHLRVVTEQAA
jgi:hypothetical protein